MTGSRNKHAWIWVAIAAISLVSVSHAANEGGPRVGSNSVLHFFVKSYSSSAAKSGPAARLAQRSSLFRDAQNGVCLAFLPVCFIGLIPPLLSSSRFVRAQRPSPPAPLIAAAFQRPPPVFA
jgi:hypothetical protein